MNTTATLPTTADDAATINGWSDRWPATIIHRTAKTITVREDAYSHLLNRDDLTFRVGGFCAHVEGEQHYEYYTDPGGIEHTYTLRKNGRWVRRGKPANANATLTIGTRARHYDFNF